MAEVLSALVDVLVTSRLSIPEPAMLGWQAGTLLVSQIIIRRACGHAHHEVIFD